MKWTTEPPIEPGRYWFRTESEGPDVVIVKQDIGPQERLYVVYHSRAHFGALLDELQKPCEWWPEKIEPPESES